MGEYRKHRPGRRRRARLAWIAGAVVLIAGLGATRCLPQGTFYSPRAGGGEASELAARTLVVYNSNDPLSRDLADFYAAQRGIAGDHVTGLNCPTEEEISRQQYDDSIAAPLRQLFDDRHWWMRTATRPDQEPASIVSSNQIRIVALIRGMPLKVRPTTGYPGDLPRVASPLRDHNEASVDSEVAALGVFSHVISGPLNNPYFRSYRRINEAEMPAIMLVARLDAITGSTVRRMITDGIAAEKNGLWGHCYVDARGLKSTGDPMVEGDLWIRHIAQSDNAPLRLPTVFDERPELFGNSYPMRAAALYFGWYTENIAGPFLQSGFRFQPGAVAFHLHSFSATTLRDPLKGWTAPLLEKGAAASLGNVYEPYLGLTTHFDVFSDRLFDGYTLVESAYAGTPGLSWMNIVVGDPLYRPARVWQQAAIDGPGPRPADGAPLAAEGRAYLQGAQTWRAKGAGPGAQALQKSGRQLHSGLIFEGLAFLQSSAGQDRPAHASLQQAARFYSDPADRARVTLTEARLFADVGQTDKALALLNSSQAPRNSQALAEFSAELGARAK